MTQITPTICFISRFSTKSIVFEKMFHMPLTAKKVDYIYEECLNLTHKRANNYFL